MNPERNPENSAQTQLDNRMAKAKPVKLGWTTEETKRITGVLNGLLANYAIHFQKLRSCHWNVKGPEFFALHREFEEQYLEAMRNIDQTAERIRVFGETPVSLLQDYLDLSEIQEVPPPVNAEIMVRELLNDYRILLEHMHAVIRVAVAVEDSGTEDMINSFIRPLETHHWMLTSFLAK